MSPAAPATPPPSRAPFHAAPPPRPGPEGTRLDIHVPSSTLARVVVALLLVVIVVKLWLAFLIFLVAVLFALTLDPVVRRMERHGVKRDTGVLLLAVASILVIGTGVVTIVPPICLEIGALVKDFDWIRGRIDGDLPADSLILRGLVDQVMTVLDSEEMKAWFDRPLVWGQMAFNLISGGIVVLMLALYLLVDGVRAYMWLLSYVPRRHRDRMAETATGVTAVVRSYVGGQLISSLLCGAFTLALLTFLGVPAALPLAVAAALLDVVPILGTIALTLASTTLALTVSPAVAGIVFAANVGYQLFENYVIVPRVYGQSMRLSTLAVILALMVGGLLQGVLGAFLVLPLAAAYPIIERIWLRKYLGKDVVTDHTALADSVGTTAEGEVEGNVLRGDPHDGVEPIPPASSGSGSAAPAPPLPV